MGAKGTNNTIAKLLALTAGLLVLIPTQAYALDENGNMTAAEFNRWDWEQQQAKKARAQKSRPSNGPSHGPSRHAAESDDSMPILANPKQHANRHQNDDDMPVIGNPKKHASLRHDDDDVPVIPSSPQGPRHTSAPVRGPKRVTATVIDDDQSIPVSQPQAVPSAGSVKGKPKRLREVVSDVQPIPQAIPTAPAPAPSSASVPAPANDQPAPPKVRGPKRVVVSDSTPPAAEPPPILQTNAPAAPVVEQPTIPTEQPTIPKVHGAKRVVATDTTPAVDVPTIEQTSAPTEQPTVPAVRGPKRLRDVIAEMPATSIPAAAEASATIEAPAACGPGLTAPATGVAASQKFGADMRKMIAQTSAPVGDEEVEYVEQYDKYQEVVKKEPRPQISTPVKPQNEFVKKLLSAAKLEAAKSCRSTSHGRVCRPGKPKGMCLQGVRMAFQKASGQSTGVGWTMNAKDAGRFVKNYGYHKISIKDSKDAPPGSVFIYVKPGAPSYAGHIEIKGTDGFYSDFFARKQISTYMNRRLQEVWVPN